MVFLAGKRFALESISFRCEFKDPEITLNTAVVSLRHIWKYHALEILPGFQEVSFKTILRVATSAWKM